MNNLFPPPKKNASSETVNTRPEKAILVSVILDEGFGMDPDASLDELEALLNTAGGVSVGRVVQTRHAPEHATYIGSGKLEELYQLCRIRLADLVVFDCELTPSQIQNLENALQDVRVIDRTMLILDIFAMRAKSSEGILQVSIANLKYSLPRLTGQGKDLSRLGGGIGTRGPGETKLETDRRHIKRKIQHLQEELSSLARTRENQRKRSQKSGLFQIALAGYTNAGKSTLLNRLCEENIYAKDQLFATLDPTTRRLRLPHFGEVLLTDTVGFINRLPHHLIEAFASTLDEVVFSDLVLLVMDASDPHFQQKTDICESILLDLFKKRNVLPPPFLYVLNKADRPESIFTVRTFPAAKNHVSISAKTGEGTSDLLTQIEAILSQQKCPCTFFLPHEEAGRLSYLYQVASVQEVEYETDGIRIRAVCDAKTRGVLLPYLMTEKET